MLAEFDLVTPQSLTEALEMLSDRNGNAVPLAGGTNLVVDLRDGRCQAARLVNIEGLCELQEIQLEEESLVIGSGVTIARLLQDERIQKYALPLWQAARVFANPLVRNRATVGGNLADASPAADTAPPLLALGAEVELGSLQGSRRLPLNEFFVSVRRTRRMPHELIAALRVPLPIRNCNSGFSKLGLRKADAISIASAAVMVEYDERKICQSARIALGSVAPIPLRASSAESFLQGRPLSGENIHQASQIAASATSPISDLRASVDYRRRMVAVLVERLLGGRE